MKRCEKFGGAIFNLDKGSQCIFIVTSVGKGKVCEHKLAPLVEPNVHGDWIIGEVWSLSK